MSKDYLEKELPLEAKRRFIFISLVIAFIVNLFPLQEIIFLLRPDFVALTLLFWNINQPHQAGMSVAFTSGIIMDVCNSSILGQHALAYCFMSFLAIILHRRLVLFSIFQQAPQIFLDFAAYSSNYLHFRNNNRLISLRLVFLSFQCNRCSNLANHCVNIRYITET